MRQLVIVLVVDGVSQVEIEVPSLELLENVVVAAAVVVVAAAVDLDDLRDVVAGLDDLVVQVGLAVLDDLGSVAKRSSAASVALPEVYPDRSVDLDA